MIDKSTKLATIPEQPSSEASTTSIDNILKIAVEKKVPVETMERLLAMRRELRAETAKELYDHAMAELQGELPVIQKKKEGGKTNSGQVAYYYAPLEDIVEQTREIISRHGFSYAIRTVVENDHVTSTCLVTHRAGHCTESNMQVPVGKGTQIMSAPQIVAAASTFAKRYAFCNAFGIMTGDADTDASRDTVTVPTKPKVEPPAEPKQPTPGEPSDSQQTELGVKVARMMQLAKAKLAAPNPEQAIKLINLSLHLQLDPAHLKLDSVQEAIDRLELLHTGS